MTNIKWAPQCSSPYLPVKGLLLTLFSDGVCSLCSLVFQVLHHAVQLGLVLQEEGTDNPVVEKLCPVGRAWSHAPQQEATLWEREHQPEWKESRAGDKVPFPSTTDQSTVRTGSPSLCSQGSGREHTRTATYSQSSHWSNFMDIYMKEKNHQFLSIFLKHMAHASLNV